MDSAIVKAGRVPPQPPSARRRPAGQAEQHGLLPQRNAPGMSTEGLRTGKDHDPLNEAPQGCKSKGDHGEHQLQHTEPDVAEIKTVYSHAPQKDAEQSDNQPGLLLDPGLPVRTRSVRARRELARSVAQPG